MNQHRSTSTSSKPLGFTLSELLIVVAIIALLGAILFPVFAKAREKAIFDPFGCESNLRRIGDAFDQYLQDNDDTYPDAVNDTRECGTGVPCWYYHGGPNDHRHTWETSILPYLKVREFLVCPDDSKAGYRGLALGDAYKGFPVSYSANGMVSCYTAVDAYSGCYCRGVMCQASVGFYGGTFGIHTPNTGIIFSDVHHPEATVAVTETWSADVDAIDPNGNWTKFGDWNEIGGQSGNYPNFGDKVPCGIPSAISPNSSTAFAVCGVNGAVSTHHGRYKDLANFLFADGHVAALSPPTTNPTSSIATNPLPNGDTYDPNDQWDATRP